MRNAIYLLAALGILFGVAGNSRADIPPTPEQKKKIEETPRIMPKGEVTRLMDRPFSRTVGAGKAKVVIPKAVFDELVAAVKAKGGAEIVPNAKSGVSLPPISLIFGGLAISSAILYAMAKAPRFRAATAVAGMALVGGGFLFLSQNAQANLGPIPRPHLAKEGQIILEVPSEGTEVVIYLPGGEMKPVVPVKP